MAAVQGLTGGAGVDYSIEANGSAQVVRQAFDSLNRVGTCAVLGVPSPPDAEVSLSGFAVPAQAHPAGRRLGRQRAGHVHPGPGRAVPPGEVPVHRLITFYDFDQINRAAVDSWDGAVVNPVLRMP